MRLKYLFGGLWRTGEGNREKEKEKERERKKDRDREKGREKKETHVHTPRERTERGQDGDERSEVAGSGRDLPLKGTRDQKE